ncbi:unnamed protein product [Phaeothamnion confervicola]
MQIPLVADTTKAISAGYGVLLQDKGIALRGLFIINPDGVLEQITVNNLGIGRSVSETLRLLQAYQYVAEHGEVCPADWKPGQRTMVADAEKSLEYFEAVASAEAEDDPLKAGARVKVIKSKHDYEATIKAPLAVVDFVAPWCGKCRQIQPYVNELSEQFTNVTFAKFDTTGALPPCSHFSAALLPLTAHSAIKNRHPSIHTQPPFPFNSSALLHFVEVGADLGVAVGRLVVDAALLHEKGSHRLLCPGLIIDHLLSPQDLCVFSLLPSCVAIVVEPAQRRQLQTWRPSSESRRCRPSTSSRTATSPPTSRPSRATRRSCCGRPSRRSPPTPEKCRIGSAFWLQDWYRRRQRRPAGSLGAMERRKSRRPGQPGGRKGVG